MISKMQACSEGHSFGNHLSGVPAGILDVAPASPALPPHSSLEPRPLLSPVVPCHNEQEVLLLFVERTSSLLKELDAGYHTEILLINDGCSYSTWPLICDVVRCDGRFRSIKLSRYFGQQAAVTCGYEFGTGDAVVSLDADLQDPPELIPDMIARWRAGADVVFTVRVSQSGETRGKLLSARLFYWLGGWVCGRAIRTETRDFRLFSRRSLDAFLYLREQYRYVCGMIHWLGFHMAEVFYDRPGRAAGRAKYSYRALATLAVEAFITSGRYPLELAGWLMAAVAHACCDGSVCSSPGDLDWHQRLCWVGQWDY